jgi:hypothetical protein
MKKNWMKIVTMMLIACFLVAPFALASEQNITGKVEQTDQGIVISANDGNTYMVQGHDLSDMVGKTVKATGTLSEDNAGKTITVITVTEVKK